MPAPLLPRDPATPTDAPRESTQLSHARQLLRHPRSPAEGDPSNQPLKKPILHFVQAEGSIILLALTQSLSETRFGRGRVYPYAFVYQDIRAPESAQGYLQVMLFKFASSVRMHHPRCLSCIKNINGRDFKGNRVKAVIRPATTTGKYFTGSFDIRFDTTGCGINP